MHTTTNHQEIQSWVLAQQGIPAQTTTGGTNSNGALLCIRFPGTAEQTTVKAISWEEWFRLFESKQLAFAYATGEERDRSPQSYQIVSRQQPVDRHLQAPAEANRDKHIDFLSGEEDGEDYV